MIQAPGDASPDRGGGRGERGGRWRLAVNLPDWGIEGASENRTGRWSAGAETPGDRTRHAEIGEDVTVAGIERVGIGAVQSLSNPGADTEE